MLAANLAAIVSPAWRIEERSCCSLADGVGEAWLRFETDVGRGRGVLRLKDGRPGRC